jgi:predicted membrane channel-forming protein YqfA (hemolysin III family)
MSLGWIGALLDGLSSLSFLSSKTDPLFFVMHLLSIVAFIGGALAMLWAAWVSWSERRVPAARLWTMILALSALVLLWIAFLYHLMSFGSKY